MRHGQSHVDVKAYALEKAKEDLEKIMKMEEP